VTRFLAKLVLLCSMLLMPLGMSAAATSAPHHGTAAHAMPVEHCSDQQSGSQSKSGIADCTMACAAALPAADIRPQRGVLIICEPVTPAGAQRLRDLPADPATPPPKQS
jgi:hypothetical protein